ncbi:sugar ABC transporter substrate-binding protein [Luteimicrobium subarcticum]|uniref:Carbohydrate ABC transporter substrate-binding protein (CUT1 family) n=1 Tax=Luteimicrobium subarcticum TaxID=620910 RepID=A0A2M8W1P1_9MICO|nr:maltose ABC transporter substrate-binding protein [Luteimicrobium subarcticum]PJI84829.1 carbohydrate ABC transporter substrate-binding protein (CUT1 family) [Luteimicrobium subarcticum]
MRRSILSALVVGAASLALAACSSGSGDDSGDGGASSTASSAPQLSGTLTVWVDETRIDSFKPLAKEYQEKTGVTVKLVQKASGDIRADFVKQVPTGQGPDVIIGAHDWTGQFVTNGVVQPIQLGDKKSDFEPVSVSAFTYDGSVYGLPYATENIALVRNNKLASDTPDTFDDLVTQGQGVVAKDSTVKYPVLIQQGAEGDAYHLYPLQTSFGAPVFKQNTDGSYTNEIAMGGDNGHKFAEYLQKLGKEKVLNVDIDGQKAHDAFIKGQSPYMVTGPWYVNDFKKANMDVTVLPVPSAGGEKSLPFVGVQGAFISAKTQNAILANDFVVNFLGSEAVQTELYKSGGRSPALTSALDKVDDPILKQFAAAAGTAPMPSIPEMDSVWQFWGKTEVQIISGKASDPDKAWDTMVSNIQKAIDG